MSANDETQPVVAAAEAGEETAAAATAAAAAETAAAEEKKAESSTPATEDAKQKEKEEKERVKREKDEEKKRQAEEKKRKAEEEKRKKEEEKQAKAEAKAKAKAEAKAAAAEATASKPRWFPDYTIDIVSRDKNQINSHINVQFEDIIAEPDPTVFSFDNVWTVSYKVFTSTKLWCYRIISLICAVPAAFCWGIEFALLSFCTIWCWQPSLKAFDISLWYTRRIYEILLKVFVEPCFHAAGKCLSHLVVTVRHEA